MPTLTAETLASLNPATGETVGEVAITPAGEIGSVVATARAAQPAWWKLGVEGRRDALLPAGRKLVDRADELGLLLTREMGKPLAEATGEVKGCGASTEKTLESMLEAFAPETLEDDKTTSQVYRDPFGVAAVISPWNFPLAMPHWMMIPALMAGNTVVLKPSEETPLIAQAYADILNETLPDDVLQVVHGADQQGKSLVESDVDLIAFTGSRETGMKILNAASDSLKRVILELGGKDPMIVLADADLDEAAEFAVHNSFRNAGQVCVSTERIYVEDSVAEQFQEKMKTLVGEMIVGDGTAEGTRIGPMINAQQRDHVLAQLEVAKEQGATVVIGDGVADGNFIRPVILTNLNNEMDIMREETFGPVACIVSVKDSDEAVALANDTPFGLGATVFGEKSRASEVGRLLEAGMIGVNKSCGGASGSPWVGAKQSGFGYHSGKEGHRQFAQARVVSSPR